MKTARRKFKQGFGIHQPRRVYSHEIPRSIRLTLLSYAEECEPYAFSLLSRELNLPVDVVARYCRLLDIDTYFSWCEDEKCICGFKD